MLPAGGVGRGTGTARGGGGGAMKHHRWCQARMMRRQRRAEEQCGFCIVPKLLHSFVCRVPAPPAPSMLGSAPVPRGLLTPQRTCGVKHRRTQALCSSIHTDDVLLFLHACKTWKAFARPSRLRSERACSLFNLCRTTTGFNHVIPITHVTKKVRRQLGKATCPITSHCAQIGIFFSCSTANRHVLLCMPYVIIRL